jgi:hypothetical protein
LRQSAPGKDFGHGQTNADGREPVGVIEIGKFPTDNFIETVAKVAGQGATSCLFFGCGNIERHLGKNRFSTMADHGLVNLSHQAVMEARSIMLRLNQFFRSNKFLAGTDLYGYGYGYGYGY